jgi:thiol-disulfide isomerase/thioredoxin
LLNKKRLIDIGLVIIILVMGAFVVFRIDRVVGELRGAVGGIELSQDVTMTQTPSSTPEPEEDQEAMLAPDFNLSSLGSGTVTLSNYRGSAVMINFWAIWCPPCRAELPLIQSFADLYEDELVVLAVNAGEDRTNVYHFVNEFNYDLIFVLDPSNSLAPKYGVRGLPTSVFIDVEGLIQARHIGILSEELLADYLSQVGVVE